MTISLSIKARGMPVSPRFFIGKRPSLRKISLHKGRFMEAARFGHDKGCAAVRIARMTKGGSMSARIFENDGDKRF